MKTKALFESIRYSGHRRVRRMIRVARLALTICVSIILFVLVSASSADTIHLHSCSTSSSGDGSEQNPFRTLKEAVADAAPGDTLTFRRGSYPIPQSQHLVIDTPVTITAVNGSASIGQYGNLVRTVRVLTHNVFGLDGSCPSRTRRFGQIVANNGILPPQSGSNEPSYDIVGVQEYWFHENNDGFGSCDNRPLFDAISPTYPEEINRFLFKPKASRLGDILFVDQHGGLGTFTIHNMTKKRGHDWEGHTVFSCLRQGFTFTRITVSANLELDVYNVHPCAEAGLVSREDELRQLANTISEVSSTSGNPVLVMGDFNFDSSEYESIIRELEEPRDVWLEAHNPGDPGVTTRGGRRIDYIFLMTSPRLVNTRFVLRPTNAQVRRWTMPNLVDPISDHFGVEATINIHNCR